jgi:hypothetical protein
VPPGDSTIFRRSTRSSATAPRGRYASLWLEQQRPALADGALAWYLVGEKTGDPAATALAERLFLEAWANAPWKRPGQDVDDWSRGATLRMVAYAAYVLWDELDPAVRQQVFQDLYDQAITYAGRLPESGYVGDSKAEENAWHAAFLAAVVNLFPDMQGYDLDWIEAKARCFAYHAITQASDAPYCGLTTQTVWPDWHLENHGQDNPLYSSAVLSLLGEAAFTYRLAGRTIPWEFRHNVQPLFDKYMTYVDLDTYHYLNASPDWSGAHSTAYTSPTTFRYMDVLGIPTGLDWQAYLARRSLFYYDMSSEWIKKDAASIRLREWNQMDRTEDSYKFFLDSVDAGEFYALAILSLDLPPAPEVELIFLPLVVDG